MLATLRRNFGYISISVMFMILCTLEKFTKNMKKLLWLPLKYRFLYVSNSSYQIAVKPTQSIEHLGFILSSTLMTDKLTDQKAMKIYEFCKQIYNKDEMFIIRQVPL